MSDTSEAQALVRIAETIRTLRPLTEEDNKITQAKFAEAVARSVTCACGKPVPFNQLPKPTFTGAVHAYDIVCVDCPNPPPKELCKIVCCGCKAVIARLDPHRRKDGFEFERGKYYHIKACPVCDATVESAQVIEKIIWDRKRKG